MKQKIILIGGGGHCKSCIDVIEQEGKFRIIGILDMPELLGNKILGYDIIGTDSDLSLFSKTVKNFLVTIGQIKSVKKRITLCQMVKESGGNLPVIISPDAYVAKSARIGVGTIIMHQAVINSDAQVGENCIINTKALVEHEAFVGDFSHISTGSIVNGQAYIGNQCFIGSNSVVANNITITDGIILAAGSQVLNNLKLPGIYFGNPLKKIR